MNDELTVDRLAQEIRRVDGDHKLGAGALAEALMPYLSRASGSEGAVAWTEEQWDAFLMNNPLMNEYLTHDRIKEKTLACGLDPQNMENMSAVRKLARAGLRKTIESLYTHPAPAQQPTTGEAEEAFRPDLYHTKDCNENIARFGESCDGTEREEAAKFLEGEIRYWQQMGTEYRTGYGPAVVAIGHLSTALRALRQPVVGSFARTGEPAFHPMLGPSKQLTAGCASRHQPIYYTASDGVEDCPLCAALNTEGKGEKS